MKRHATLLVVATLISCAHHPKEQSPTQAPRQTAPSQQPTAKVEPRKEPTTPNDERLRTLVEALKEKNTEDFSIVELIDQHLPGFSSGQGKTWPRTASVELFAVDNDALPGAIVLVKPKGFEKCAVPPSTSAYTLFVGKDGSGRLAPVFQPIETRLFEADTRKVSFPEIPTPFPVFWVEHSGPVDRCDPGFGSEDKERVVEILGSVQGCVKKLGQVILERVASRSGTSVDDRTDMSWVRGKVPGSAYIVTVQIVKTRTPKCGDNSCRGEIYACSRTVTVFALDKTKGLHELSTQQVDTLRKSDPSFFSLKTNAEVSTRSACAAL